METAAPETVERGKADSQQVLSIDRVERFNGGGEHVRRAINLARPRPRNQGRDHEALRVTKPGEVIQVFDVRGEVDIIFYVIMEGESSQQQPLDAANEEEITVDSFTEQGQSRQSSSLLAPVFKREEYAKQYEFNATIIRKLLLRQEYQEISPVVTDAFRDLQTRNETLKIVNDYPEVLQFLFFHK
ncbi:unnamed protein product [Heligmosomoides polygyrus]|uniref:Uncharacterized protein n=1 Tax=Heligmosomoides polygyrus TaxID=6339 RepID=A0A183G3T9_HELPZ|nr:unnamed protein product [Heligmosomoides polygyrus]